MPRHQLHFHAPHAHLATGAERPFEMDGKQGRLLLESIEKKPS